MAKDDLSTELAAIVPTAMLRDGQVVTIRHVRPNDEVAIRAMTSQLTPHDLRCRFFLPLRSVSPSFAVRLTHLDANREVALLAFPIGNTDSIPWALGSIHADTSKQRAEFAIAVRSDHHDDGLGTALMKNLLKIAAERGIHEIWGDVLSDNSQMLELCRTLGFHRKRSPSDPSIIRVWFMLDQQPPGFNRS